MNKSVQKKIREFVEQEQSVELDEKLLAELRSFLAQDTLYWTLPAKRRKTLNVFFRELKDEFIRESLTGEYGASVVLESLIVTAFESGWRLRAANETL